MTPEDRIEQIGRLLPALTDPELVALLNTEAAALTARLVWENDEQTRGRIKQLRALIDLPAALQSERDQIQAALSDQDAAD